MCRWYYFQVDLLPGYLMLLSSSSAFPKRVTSGRIHLDACTRSIGVILLVQHGPRYLILTGAGIDGSDPHLDGSIYQHLSSVFVSDDVLAVSTDSFATQKPCYLLALPKLIRGKT
jgi:hypothetical protein